ARLGEARDEPLPDGITDSHHNDGDRLGRLLGRQHRWRRHGGYDVHLEADQLGREVGEPLVLPLRPSVLHDDVLALDIAQVAQPLLEGLAICTANKRGARTEPADPVYLSRRRRLGGERRHEEAEGGDDDEPTGAVPHSDPLWCRWL